MKITTNSTKAYVLLSGGQDSFVSLIWALNEFKSVETVTIAYKQSHEIEIEYAKRIAKFFNVPNFLYNLGDFMQSIAKSSLFDKSDHTKNHAISKNLPASFVPNRNGLFLTIASNHAFKNREKHIHLVTGTCETDYSGYPDCRNNYIKAKEIELSLGLDIPVSIHTPLMWKNKADTFKMADEANMLNEVIELTMTCYEGEEKLNEWGRGCGVCPACNLRKKGFSKFIHLKNNSR